MNGHPTAKAGAMLLLLGLSACGGGGGGGGGVNATPAPPPVTQPPPPSNPTPTPPATTPTTTNFNDAEYQRSNAARLANALTAYSAGATGAGVRIAILDSGLSDPLGEFTGRIDPASRDMVASRGITDPDGHGTSVAAVAAAGRTGREILGVAFGATVLALRTDEVGSCGSTDGCEHDDRVLAQGIDLARTTGARVVNMSLGGSAPSSTLVAAINRATSAGMIIVISAGNDGADGATNPDPFAQVANTAQARGLVIIAGAHDNGYNLASFSNPAGTFGQYYLTALGDRVRAFDQTGTAFLFSGTSYAAPTIAGAVALLAQAFPTLTGAQIVDLLMTTATDAGAAGTDSVYGRGILNLTRAFQPQGQVSLAGSQVPVSLTSSPVLGSAMGDAMQGGASLGQAVVLDSYARAYALDLTAGIGRTAGARPLARAIGGDIRSASAGAGRIVVSLTVSRDQTGQPWVGLAQLGLTRDDSRAARALAGMAAMRIDGRTQAGLGFAEAGGALARMLSGEGTSPFIVARDPADVAGFEARRGFAMALRHDLGAAALTVTAERGTVADYRRDGETEPGYMLATATLSREFGALSLSAGAGLLSEDGSVLGSRFGGAFGGGSARTMLADLGAKLALGDGWQLGAAWRQGWTRAAQGGAMAQAGSLKTSAFAFDIGRTGEADRWGLRVAQPLRVSSGGFSFNLPVSYDYATGAVGYALRRLDLAPEGRELDVEAAWGRRVGAGWVDTNLFWRRDPGNIAAAPDDVGGAVRFTMGF